MAQVSSQSAGRSRDEVLSWDEYFMGIAFLSAQRSKDPNTLVGACIVNKDMRIVGTGYNGMPNRCPDDSDAVSWKKNDGLDSKYWYVCHAEMNAITNRFSASLEGCTIYVALFPCNECAKLIIQSGIRHVIYYSDKDKEKDSTKASKKMLDLAGVEYEEYLSKPKIVIDFEEAVPK